MKKSRVASNALNNPKAGYSQLARLEPTAFERRSRRLQLTALEQLSKVLEAKQEIDPHTKKPTLPLVVKAARQLAVDLWRLQSGKVTARELNLVMQPIRAPIKAAPKSR